MKLTNTFSAGCLFLHPRLALVGHASSIHDPVYKTGLTGEPPMYRYLIAYTRDGKIEAKPINFSKPSIVTDEDYYELCAAATPEHDRTYVQIFSIQPLPISHPGSVGLTG